MRFPHIPLVVALLGLVSLFPAFCKAEGPPISGKKIVGYFAEWGIYQRDYHVSEIPASMLNVINYAFANLTAEGEVVLYDSYAAVEKAYPEDTWDQPLRGNFNQLRKLKKKNPHLVLMISIGGWTLSTNFSAVASSAEGRARFAKSAVAFMRKYGFDGVDIDWEYPGGGGLAPGKPEDKRNFTTMLRHLRLELNAETARTGRRYYLTIAAPAGADKIANMEVGAVGKLCDWINIMTYDLHGAWENRTNHHAALYANDSLSADAAVKNYLAKGVPPKKLVLGIPFYGRAWKNVRNQNRGLFQPAFEAPMGTWGVGMFDYHDLVRKLSDAPSVWNLYYDSKRVAPWIHAPSVENGVMVTYDNPESIRAKMRYVRGNKLGGAMFWELSGDTVDSSLLQAIYRGLVP